jgi:hypothetical protein
VNRPVILALDLATRCGWAKGRVGDDPPTFGSIRFGAAGASDAAVFAHCLRWLSAELEPQPRPDILMIESMLPPEAKVGNTTGAVRDRLAGLHGIVRAVAHLRGIHDIGETSVQSVRAHFISNGKLKRDAAKAEVVRVCRALDWNVDNDNEGDACALWSYAVSLIDPSQTVKLSPLFNKAIRATA